MLYIYNTLSGKLERFEVLNNKVKMYVCGPTVYNFIHIGNARPYIFFDIVRRYLKYLKYDVTYVQNFTDIDDKIINLSLKEKSSIIDISEKYIREYLKDSDSLNILRADIYPKVSESIDKIVKIIENLIEKGYGYEKDDGITKSANVTNYATTRAPTVVTASTSLLLVAKICQSSARTLYWLGRI